MQLVLSTALCLLIGGCGSDRSDPKTTIANDGDPSSANGVTQPRHDGESSLSPTKLSLVGKWSTGCHFDDGCADCGSNVTTFDYSESSYVETIEVFFDRECRNKTVTYVFEGIFELGNVVAGDTVEYNATASKYLMAYNNVDSIDAVNQQVFCGFSDWAHDELKDLTSTECDSAGDYRRTGVQRFSSIEITASTEALRMGGTHDWHRGFSKEDRIAEIGGPVFSKQ